MAEDPIQLRCRDCEHAIVCCEFCDAPDCQSAICYRCMILALGESIPQPHAHGG